MRSFENGAWAEGVRLFNQKRFFEAHEALEALWLEARGDEKVFLHGLIQVAAAFHHLQRNNPAGFRSLLEKSWRKLEKFGGTMNGIQLAALKKQLGDWRNYLRRAKNPRPETSPPWPRIERL